MSELTQIKTFVHAVENNGFTNVAKKYGVSTAAISKQIAKLETRLNIRLFNRTTRRVSLTETGQIYYEQCKQVLNAIDEAERVVSQYHTEPAGRLRITSGRYFAEKYIIPYLTEFTTNYPKIVLDIEVAERTPDLATENIDIIFGSDNIASAGLIKKPITASYYDLCASPTYLQQYDIPQEPNELVQHRYITHSMREPNNILAFNNNQQLCLIPSLFFNDANSMLQAAINGVGIVSLQHYIVADAIKKGLLIPILKEYSLKKRPIYLFYKKSHYIEPKIRSFIDFILSKNKEHLVGSKKP